MSRSGPTGTAHTTASAVRRVPSASTTSAPPSTAIRRTGAESRSRSPSSAAIRSGTLADPSATVWFSHASRS